MVAAIGTVAAFWRRFLAMEAFFVAQSVTIG
jgi:hypothetical protein